MTAVYTEDRKTHPGTKIYTLSPTAEFVLAKLFTPDAQKPELSSFRATVFRGHLERRGKPINGLEDIVVTVKQVMHAQKFEPVDDKPEELTYFIFGKGMELFLAHSISKPPDFDQILSVKVIGHSFTDAELGKGIKVTIPGRPNEASERVKEAQQVTGVTQTADVSTSKISFKADKEIYFEEGELLVPPTFDDTKLEQAKN